eukprot:9064318-Alexandrium_andersonii.AAC.1
MQPRPARDAHIMQTKQPRNLQQHDTHREAARARRGRSAMRCTSSTLGRNSQSSRARHGPVPIAQPGQPAVTK